MLNEAWTLQEYYYKSHLSKVSPSTFFRWLFLFNYIMEKEIFKAIPGYEGCYEVSDLGRVKSLSREIKKGKIIFTSKERILKPVIITTGYYKVSLRKDSKTETKKVHKLVAIAFLNNIPNGTTKLVVDHIDNNKINNRLDNLQLISQRENTSKESKGSSKHIGVSWFKRDNKWHASITVNGRKIYLGSFKYEEKASNAYQEALTRINNGLSAKVDK